MNVPKGTVFKTANLEGVKLNDSVNPLVLIYEGEQIGKRSFAGKCEIQIIVKGEEQ